VNAIHDAVGVLITDLPATPEKIFMAMQAKKAEEAARKAEVGE
jgi:5'-deoxynucleotidase YfbR-like HD superfamily hydrolase